MVRIRTATYHDAANIKLLIAALGYKTTTSLLVDQLENLFGRDDDLVYVYEMNKDVLGFIAIHFMPQLAFDGGLAFISYLSVDETAKDHGIAKALEDHVCKEALKRKCDRIQVHCMDWRTPEQKFYLEQGYQLYPNFYTKRLVYAE